jgi:hypothetical protein
MLWLIVEVVGAALVCLGCFLPWAELQTPFGGPITKSGIQGDGVFLLVLVVAAALVGYWVWRSRFALAVILLALLVLVADALIVFEWIDLSNRYASIAQDTGEFSSAIRTSYGEGLYLVAIGAIVMSVGALVLAVTRRATNKRASGLTQPSTPQSPL